MNWPQFIFCLSGLLYQVTEVSQVFFAFKTIGNIELSIPVKIGAPSLSVCFRITDVLKKDVIKERFGWNDTNGDDKLQMFQKMVEIPIKELLGDLTPATDEVMDTVRMTIGHSSCITRFNYSLQFNQIETCLELFNIVKYLQREFVCYKFESRFPGPELDILEYSLGPYLFNMIYTIHFNESTFKEVEYMASYVHLNDSDPLIDSIFGKLTLIPRYPNGDLPLMTNTFQAIETDMLPAPYDTNCRNFQDTEYKSHTQQVLMAINSEIVSSMNMTIPMLQISDGSLETKLLISGMLTKPETAQKLQLLSKKYAPKHSTCKLIHTISKSVIYKHGYFAASMEWPDDVNVRIRSDPVFKLLDYIVFISSCFGLWFGISVHSLINHLERPSLKLFKNQVTPVKVPVKPENNNDSFKSSLHVPQNHLALKKSSKQEVTARVHV